jgi:hypothetical protein
LWATNTGQPGPFGGGRGHCEHQDPAGAQAICINLVFAFVLFQDVERVAVMQLHAHGAQDRTD